MRKQKVLEETGAEGLAETKSSPPVCVVMEYCSKRKVYPQIQWDCKW